MQPRKSRIALGCLTAGFSLGGLSTAWSQVVSVEPERSAVLQSRQKPSVRFDMASATSNTPKFKLADVNTSMRRRRDMAWSIVADVWKPVQVSGGTIPAWMLWYEQEDIELLYREMSTKVETPDKAADAAPAVEAELQRYSTKDLQASLSRARLGRVLRQTTFPQFRAMGPHVEPGTGSIYYNYAYVKHFLANAVKIANCDLSAFATPLVRSGQAQIQRQDADNIYALCMDSEMPPDAVMIKVAWTPIVLFEGQFEGTKAHDFDLSASMAAKLPLPPAGQWLEEPFGYFNGTGIQSYGFDVADDQGQRWQLTGMHIASKKLRTWMWITLFRRASGWEWTADKPRALDDVGLRSYGMAAVSDFKEGDPSPATSYDGVIAMMKQKRAGQAPKPWSEYKGDDKDFEPHVAVLKAVSQVMNGAQWASNPYIESTMARGNCIGCHQGSTDSFLPTQLFKKRNYNISDFSFSFATNRAAIKSVMEEQTLRRKLKVSRAP